MVLSEKHRIELTDMPYEIRSCPRKCTGNDTVFEIRSEALLKALKKITVATKHGKRRYWHKRIRCITIEQIHRFLANQGCQWFSRKKFGRYLQHCTQSGVSKYKTAGVYLTILTNQNICLQNGKKANQSAYKLHDRFYSNSKNHQPNLS